MESDPSLYGRVWVFAVALWNYWWLVVTGIVLVIEQAVEANSPDWLKRRLDKWLSPQTRRRMVRWGSFGALLIASFLAFDDLNSRNRELQQKVAAAETSASNLARERDDARRQMSAKADRAAIKAKLLDFYAQGAPLADGGGLPRTATPEAVKAYVDRVAVWRDTTKTWIEQSMGRGAASRFENISIQYQRGVSGYARHQRCGSRCARSLTVL